ncbi:dri1 RNA-binding protein involved in heterochromatin assembly dri1 [Candida maltosa Xu316]
MSDIYIIVQIATTCDDSTTYVTKDSSELIELAWETIDPSTLETLYTGSILVRPINTPITPYCSKIHKISWENVKNAGSFKDAITSFDQYIQDHIVSQNQEFSLVMFDIAKLRVQLSREARDKSVALPSYLQHPRVFDIPKEYSNWQSTHPEAVSYPATSLSNIITALGVELDDVSDLYTKIVKQLIKKSIPIEDHPTVFTKPYDSGEDIKVFSGERSKVLYISNLPSDTTQSELESWFTQYGGRPGGFWTISRKGISGFVAFGTHGEAADCLALNGRVLGDRAIEVQPSSSTVFDIAMDKLLLTSFPLSKNRPRPGDWTCLSCGFSNFQRRTHCFRCSFSAVAFQDLYHNNNMMRRGANNQSQQLSSQSQQQQQQAQQQQQQSQDQGQQQQQNQQQPSAQQQSQQGEKNQHKFKLNDRGVQHYGNESANIHQQPGNGINNTSNNSVTPVNTNSNTTTNSNNNHQRSHYNNNVPFRAGDWKCEICMYHNFAKNLCCLKCGVAKPMVANHQPNPMHSVNTTAAAIAAATASGQPLNLNNSAFIGLQQTQVQAQQHHYNQQRRNNNNNQGYNNNNNNNNGHKNQYFNNNNNNNNLRSGMGGVQQQQQPQSFIPQSLLFSQSATGSDSPGSLQQKFSSNTNNNNLNMYYNQQGGNYDAGISGPATLKEQSSTGNLSASHGQLLNSLNGQMNSLNLN